MTHLFPFSKIYEIFFGYFDPVICLNIGELTDIPAEKEARCATPVILYPLLLNPLASVF